MLYIYMRFFGHKSFYTIYAGLHYGAILLLCYSITTIIMSTIFYYNNNT